MSATGLALDLPDGWFCLDVPESDGARTLAARIDDLRTGMLGREESLTANGSAGGDGSSAAGGDGSSSAAADGLGSPIDRIVASGAQCLLVRPATAAGDLAITGGIFVWAPFGVGASEIFAALDRRGESVALGDLDGMPVVSLVRHGLAECTWPNATVQVTYLFCDEQVSVVLTFTAADEFGAERVVRELARVVSRARLVR